jgi:hypothetical protein
MQGVKGEAVVVYADPLTTQQMLYHRLSRRVNNMAVVYATVGSTLDTCCMNPVYVLLYYQASGAITCYMAEE